MTRVMHDEKVLRLQEEDDNYMGDGGTSDKIKPGSMALRGCKQNGSSRDDNTMVLVPIWVSY